MIQGTVLFALMVGVMSFTPDMRFMNEKRGNEIAKMAMNQQKSVSHIFAPNARTCFNGDCSGGVHVYDGYHDKFQQFSIAYTNLVARGIVLMKNILLFDILQMVCLPLIGMCSRAMETVKYALL